MQRYEFNPDNDDLIEAFDAIDDAQDRDSWLEYMWRLKLSPIIIYDSEDVAEMVIWFDTFDNMKSAQVHFIARRLSSPLATFKTALGVLGYISKELDLGVLFAVLPDDNRIGIKTARLLGFNVIAKPSGFVYMVKEILIKE